MNWTGACVTAILSIEYQFISMSDVILSQRILMCVCNPLTTVAKMSKLLHEKTQINKNHPSGCYTNSRLVKKGGISYAVYL